MDSGVSTSCEMENFSTALFVPSASDSSRTPCRGPSFWEVVRSFSRRVLSRELDAVDVPGVAKRVLVGVTFSALRVLFVRRRGAGGGGGALGFSFLSVQPVDYLRQLRASPHAKITAGVLNTGGDTMKTDFAASSRLLTLRR